MPKTVTIPIEKGKEFLGHHGPVRQVVVREPTFEEYLKLGDPFIFMPLPEGGAIPTENLDVMRAYVQLLLVEPDYLIALGGGLDLARKIKDAIVGFFLPASAEDAGSKTSPTTSPSPGSASATMRFTK